MLSFSKDSANKHFYFMMHVIYSIAGINSYIFAPSNRGALNFRAENIPNGRLKVDGYEVEGFETLHLPPPPFKPFMHLIRIMPAEGNR